MQLVALAVQEQLVESMMVLGESVSAAAMAAKAQLAMQLVAMAVQAQLVESTMQPGESVSTVATAVQAQLVALAHPVTSLKLAQRNTVVQVGIALQACVQNVCIAGLPKPIVEQPLPELHLQHAFAQRKYHRPKNNCSPVLKCWNHMVANLRPMVH